MYRYGPRVYFDRDGTVLYQTGYIETSVEAYWENADPREWHPDLVGNEEIEMQQYGWSEYTDDFSTKKLARIDPKTRQPVFEDWPEPNEVPPIQSETEIEKAQKQIADLEQRTKVLEYAAQTTGETLDVHEGAIVDVMKLALGGSPEEL
ncbi:hypothetical protein [Saccharibacillus sacchari]|uniref:Uncharacterized protein n=1 Tax=Saccharibacillus sacchari TaxID=456493 RepID=A0ACC6PIE6_9BACL